MNLLIAFEALMEERHVTRAAIRLNMTQPAMSAALSRLRRTLDDELFVRGPRRLEPTARALELARPLGSALREIRDALAANLPFVPGASTRSLRIAASDHPGLVLLPSVVARLAVEAPGVDLRILSFRDRKEAIGLLDEGRIDVALGVSPGREARILSANLYEERFVTIARLGTDPGRLSDVARFAAARHLLVSPEGEDHGVVDDALAQLGLQRRIAVSVSNMQVAVAMVAQSDLVATVMAGLVRPTAEEAGVLVVEPPVPLRPVGFEALWHRRTEGHPALDWLRALVLDEARRLERDGFEQKRRLHSNP